MNQNPIRLRIETDADDRQIDREVTKSASTASASLKKELGKAGTASGREFIQQFKNQVNRMTGDLARQIRNATAIAPKAMAQLTCGARGADAIFQRIVFGRLPPGRWDNQRFASMAHERALRRQAENSFRNDLSALSDRRVMMARSRRVAPVNPIRAGYQHLMAGASGMYLAERTFRMFDRLLIDPAIRLGKTFIELNEDAQRFRATVFTTVGGMERAKQLDYELARQNRGLPLARADMREAAAMLMSSAGTVGSMAMSNPKQVAGASTDLAMTMAKLKLLDPLNADPKSASIAIREGLEGDVRSIQRRFGLTAETIARMAGTTPGQIRNSPEDFLRGVRNAVDTLVDQSAVDQLNNLPSQIGEHVRQAVRDAVVRIGDAGAFRAIQNRVGDLRESTYRYMDSPGAADQFNRVSGDVVRLLDNLASAGANFVHALAGTDGDNSAEAVANSIEKIFTRITDLSGALPDASENLGQFIRQIGVFVDDLFDQATRMKANLSVSGLATGIVKDWQLRLHPSMAREAELNAMSDTLGRIDPRLKFGVERQYGSSYSTQGEAFEPIANTGTGRRGILVQQLIDQLDGMRAGKRFNEPYATELHSRRSVEAYLDANFKGWRDRLAGLKDESTKINVPSVASKVPDALARFVGSENMGPNFNAMTLGVNARMNADGRRSLRDLSDYRESLIHSNFGSENDFVGLRDLHQRMRGMMDEFEREAMFAIQAGDLFGSINNDPETRALTGEAAKILERARSRYQIAADNLDDLLIQSARDFGEQLEGAIGDAPASIRAMLLEQISSGTTSLGNDIRAMLEAAGRNVGDLGDRVGIESFSPELQAQIMRQRVRAAAESGFEIADLGDLNLGQSAGEVKRSFMRRPSREAAARIALDQVRSLEIDQADLVNRSLSRYQSNPSEANAVALSQSQADFSKLLDLMRDLRIESDATFRGMIAMADITRASLAQNLGDGLADLALGFDDLGSAAKRFAEDIVRSFMRIQSENLIYGLMGQPGKGGGYGLLGGLFQSFFGGAIGSATGGAGNIQVGNTTPGTSWNVRSSARGDVYAGGLTIPRFAQGGIVNRPTFALIGDHTSNPGRGAAEAVLPLARGAGGKLGVMPHGGATSNPPNVNIVVVDNHEQAARAAARLEMTSPGGRAHILDTWANDYSRGGVTFNTAKRKG